MKIPYRPHVMYFIGVGCAGLLVGAYIGKYVSVGVTMAIVAIPLVVLSFLFRRNWMIVLLIIGATTVGAWRGASYFYELSLYQKHFGSEAHVRGIVHDDPVKTPGGIALALKEVTVNQEPMSGMIYAVVSATQELIRGQQVVIEGGMSEGFGSYGATIFRAKLIQAKPTMDIGIGVREGFAHRVQAVVGSPGSDLGMGFLTGQKSSLPTDLADALKVAGLTHVVVASGYNLTILVRFARRFLMRISKFFAAFGSVALVLSFIAVAGMGPSLERAAIVTLLSLAAWYYGRRFNPFVLLVVVAAVTVMITPSYAWGDLGWALSFLAFFGVMIVAPVLQKFLFGDKKPGTIRQILGETVSAHLMTAPFLIATFGMLSHVAVFANVLVLPFVPLAMILTFFAGITANIPLIGQLLGTLTEWLLGYMISVVYFFASLPWAQSDIELSNGVIAGAYVIIVGLAMVLIRKTKHDVKDLNIVD